MDATYLAGETATGLHENPTQFGEHTYTARRNDGEPRYQIFRDGELGPIGYLELHRCEFNEGRWQLRVYDAASAPVGLPSRHGEDHPDGGCVHSYTNALSHLRARALEASGED